uniref:SH3 domain-containing protein n=1 Tax=Setaria digitata TaxID=48799 RepID=A0A915PHF1_9BILA
MSDLFSKQLKKQTARAKEKLLEGLGKAKATQDDVFDQHAANLVKQSKACERLYRDLKAYGAALRTMVQAQKTFRETIRELYESDWPDREHLCAITQEFGASVNTANDFQSLDLQWDEFEKTVNDQVMGSVNAYMAQFSDLKAKVAKRGRKLVDFDSARNNYTTVKASSKKGDDDPKVVKALADLQQAETLYKELNRELVDALPATYDSRITFFVDTLQTIFNAESSNHAECGKNNKTLVTLLDNLGNSFDSLRIPRNASDHSVTLAPTDDQSVPNEGSSPPKSEIPTPEPRQTSPQILSAPLLNKSDAQNDEENAEKKIYPYLTATPPATTIVPGVEERNGKKAAAVSGDVGEKDSNISLNPFDVDDDDDDAKNPFNEINNEKEPHPEPRSPQKGDSRQEKNGDRKILYKVRATHRYTAEDTDELTFDAGEVITVLEAREEDLLDDGWLLGVKQSDGIRGVFPANFTKSL